VAKGPPNNVDIRVDHPQAFFVMPFGQPRSGAVHAKVFEPGIRDAGFVRVGDLGTNVWNAILLAGVIVAEVSAPNPNVYYEPGIADALGKPVFLFKQADASLPAETGGVHCFEYHLSDLAAGRARLTEALRDRAEQVDQRFAGVKALADR
jgi:hypothetical protein